MQNISDDELDKMFRAASEKGDFDFDQDAWKAMDSKLNLSSNSPGSFKSSVISSSIAGLIIMLIVLNYFSDSPSRISSDETVISNTNKNGIIKSQEYEIMQDASATNGKAGIADEDIQQQPKKLPGQLKKANEVQEEKNKALSGSVNRKDDAVKPSLKTSVIQTSNSNVTDGKNLVLTAVIEESKQPVFNRNEQMEMDGVRPQRTNENNITVVDSVSVDESVFDTQVDSAISNELNDPEKNEFRYKGQIGIKLSASPDLTSIGFGKTDRVGFNYGLLLEYQFTDRWLISSGAILSRKIYSGRDVEYTFSSTKYTADELTGDCRIIDLPINVYYFFKSTNSLSFFTSVGFTSYLMLSEDYRYTVKSGYSSNVYTQHFDRKNNDWFKQLNISFGLQKNISHKVALQIEPFLKAPLAGVGEGKVSLASLGAFFSIRYGISINKNDHE
jgi:hypothetical protein